MHTLQKKQYQDRALGVLREYFETCQTMSPETAFYQITAKYSAKHEPSAYHKLDEPELANIPYVCLRVPTGGGKTIMACHALISAMRDYQHTDSGIILWLVPSTTILTQTLNALQEPSHPYRQALDSILHNVVVKDIESALSMPVSDLAGHTCIILSTLQAFRREDKIGLRVYKGGNGVLSAHFDNIPAACQEIVQYTAEGEPVKSLQNLIAMHRPAVIVDESHNARTSLSLKVLASFHPACIVEFTATPYGKVDPSNVLYSVSARELQAENMIKMPVEVVGRAAAWRELVQDAIHQRNALEDIAKKEQLTSETREYIRPILLFQAMRKVQGDDTVIHAEALKALLIKDYRLPEEEIKIATGDKYELDGIDLLSEDCPVRYIITQQALREGWDCPFAYVLCSISESFSSTQVEQFIGRIMRLPKVTPKGFAELNKAYVFAPASFVQVANALKDALVKNGFERFEAERMLHKNTVEDQDSLFGEDTYNAAPVTVTIQITKPPAEFPTFTPSLQAHISVAEKEQTITYTHCMSAEHKDELCRIYPQDKPRIIQAYVESNKASGKTLSRIELGDEIAVPNLCVELQPDLFAPFDDEALYEVIEYTLPELTAALAGIPYHSSAGEVTRGIIGVDQGGQVTTQELLKTQAQTDAWDFDAALSWEACDLVGWLACRIPHEDMPATHMTAALSRLLVVLTDKGTPLKQLVVDKYHLLEEVRTALKEYRKEQKHKAYQMYLFEDAATPLTVQPNCCFRYGSSYPVNHRYTGSVHFNKHLYSDIGDMNNEEVECARFLDAEPQVECWVRNLELRPLDSFWLQTSTDRFYPDFMCKLTDGRILAVEYKSKDRYSNDDSKEKRIIGDTWARLSKGTCLFIMTEGTNLEAIRALIQK